MIDTLAALQPLKTLAWSAQEWVFARGMNAVLRCKARDSPWQHYIPQLVTLLCILGQPSRDRDIRVTVHRWAYRVLHAGELKAMINQS
jgi:hypothetical protein